MIQTLGDKLRKKSDNAKTKILEKESSDRRKKEDKIRQEAEESAQRIIKGLPERLGEEAAKGSKSLLLLTDETMDSFRFNVLVDEIRTFCASNGISTRTEKYDRMGSDDLPCHSQFIISWE